MLWGGQRRHCRTWPRGSKALLLSTHLRCQLQAHNEQTGLERSSFESALIVFQDSLPIFPPLRGSFPSLPSGCRGRGHGDLPSGTNPPPADPQSKPLPGGAQLKSMMMHQGGPWPPVLEPAPAGTSGGRGIWATDSALLHPNGRNGPNCPPSSGSCRYISLA